MTKLILSLDEEKTSVRDASTSSLTSFGTRSAGQVGRIYATGLGYPSEITPFVDRRVVKSFAVWNMIDLGYTAAYLAHGLATGEIKARVGETAVVGRLGPMTIESGLEVVMAEPRIYDRQTSTRPRASFRQPSPTLPDSQLSPGPQTHARCLRL